MRRYQKKWYTTTHTNHLTVLRLELRRSSYLICNEVGNEVFRCRSKINRKRKRKAEGHFNRPMYVLLYIRTVLSFFVCTYVQTQTYICTIRTVLNDHTIRVSTSYHLLYAVMASALSMVYTIVLKVASFGLVIRCHLLLDDSLLLK
jgi:hypothetical protein